jgi:DNA repair protein RecO
MHTVHHTEAIIIKSVPSGEANVRVWLFTQTFGLVIAIVQGVRKPGAKLQSHIVDFSLISCDLVKGKDTWRLVSATLLENPSRGKLRDPLLRAYVRTLAMLVRFLIGEGAHDSLFMHIKECIQAVKEGGYDAKTFDAFSLWKIVTLLGYIAPSEKDQILLSLPFGEALMHIDEAIRARLVKEVQQAMIESHL